MQETIQWSDFQRIELRVATIIKVDDFPEAIKPAYKLTLDFGTLGTKVSSAQITARYRKEELVGRQVLAVVNFPKKQIANFFSEVLTCGVADENGEIILAVPDRPAPKGARLI